MFCRSLDIDVPQLRVRGTVARTAPAEKILDGTLFDERLGIRRRHTDLVHGERVRPEDAHLGRHLRHH